MSEMERCAGCRHWSAGALRLRILGEYADHPIALDNLAGMGICELPTTDGEDPQPITILWSTHQSWEDDLAPYRPMVVTRGDFGCTAWQPAAEHGWVR